MAVFPAKAHFRLQLVSFGFLGAFCSLIFKFFSFSHLFSSTVPPVNGPFRSERTVQVFSDGPV